MGIEKHKENAPKSVRCAVVTVSDSRTEADDRSGDLAERLLVEAGHSVLARYLLPDEPQAVAALLSDLATTGQTQCVILSGGTGLSHRDRTYEAVAGLLTRKLDGFGELFRMLSYGEIGAAAMLSRAVGGAVGRMAVFALPGSPKAVELGLTKLIVPELGHIIYELNR